MKVLITISLLLSCTISLASGVWDVTSHTNNELRSRADISSAITTFPQILTKWQGEASDINYIVLTIIDFEWTGETLCEENDPRLKYKSVNFIACPEDTLSVECIYELDPILNPIGDPCKE
jgi:hypothetical protein